MTEAPSAPAPERVPGDAPDHVLGRATDHKADRTPRPRWHFDKDIANLLFKIVLAAGAGLFGHQFEQNMQTAQLLTQREQSDTQIRAEMFKAITDKLFRTDPPRRPDPQEQAVFTQLLALNFNDHIEIKPLMVSVDAKLRDAEQHGSTAQTRDGASVQLAYLRAAADVVRNRQIARIISNDAFGHVAAGDSATAWLSRLIPSAQAAAESDAPAFPQYRYLSVRYPVMPGQGQADSLDPKPSFGDDAQACTVSPDQGQTSAPLSPITETSPDGRARLTIVPQPLAGTPAEARKFHLAVTAEQLAGANDTAPPAGQARLATTQAFLAVTDYDFPITDNTLLANGARYAFVLEKVCQNGAVKLGLLWFPANYYPAHERPTNRAQLAGVLGLKH